MSDHEHIEAWAKYTEMIPEELSTAGWALWAMGDVATVFGMWC